MKVNAVIAPPPHKQLPVIGGEGDGEPPPLLTLSALYFIESL
jgi:hypothetical protein